METYWKSKSLASTYSAIRAFDHSSTSVIVVTYKVFCLSTTGCHIHLKPEMEDVCPSVRDLLEKVPDLVLRGHLFNCTTNSNIKIQCRNLASKKLLHFCNHPLCEIIYSLLWIYATYFSLPIASATLPVVSISTSTKPLISSVAEQLVGVTNY